MDTDSARDAADARAALEQIAETRRASARATRRPWWTDLGLAVAISAAVTLALLEQWLPAILLWVVGAVGFTIIQRRLARRRGQVVDQRTLGARAWRFALLYAGQVVLLQFRPPAAWLLGYAVAAGMVTLASGFWWLRWEDRYQARRLAAGDFDRYDLL